MLKRAYRAMSLMMVADHKTATEHFFHEALTE